MPQLPAVDALALLGELASDMPAIVVSGTIEEEDVARVFRAGARDFVTKDRVTRLPPAIDRELDEAAGRRERSEFRRAARVLQESEDRYRLIVETAVEGIWLLDADNRTLFANKAMAELLGYTPEELVGRSSLDFVLPEDTLHRQGEQYETRLRRRDGSPVLVSILASSVAQADGGSGTLAMVTDISERKRAEEELARSEERLRLALDAGGMGVWEWTLSTGASVRDENVVRLFGLEGRDVGTELTTLIELIHAEDRHPVSEAVAGAIERKDGLEIEFRREWPDGTLHWLASRGSAICDETGTVVRLVGVTTDVTQEKEAEEELRRSRELYRRVVESSSDLIVLVDLSGHFVYASPAAQPLLGYDPDGLVGTSVFVLVHPDDLALAHQAFAAVSSGARVDGIAVRARRKNGAHVEVEAAATLIRDSEGRPELIVATCRDVTDLRRAEQLELQLRQTQKMDAIGRLAGGVAHDFNNILLGIRSYVDLVLRRLPEDAGGSRRDIEEIGRIADRATALTRQLLAFGRKQLLKPEVLDLNGVVTEMEKLLRRLIGEDIELVTALEEEPVLVEADRSQLEQVVANLAVNAREAMRGGGRLTIEVGLADLDESSQQQPPPTKPARYAQLVVADTGCGMDAAMLTQIFEPFFTTKEDGTGLGLATVHGIVKQTHGHIAVDSQPGGGTVFTVYLPTVGAAEREEPESVGEPAPDTGGLETILLVEDDPDLRTVLQMLLEDAGYTVLSAGGGREAVRIATEHQGPIDVLLTDIVMPEVGGREIAERLAEHRPGLPVVYMSGYTDDEIVRSGVLAGDVSLLQKPFTSDELGRAVRSAFDSRTLVARDESK